MAADCPGRCKIGINMPQLEPIFTGNLFLDSNTNYFYFTDTSLEYINTEFYLGRIENYMSR